MLEQHNSSVLVLEPEQYEALTQLASKQNRTISDVAREVVRLGLESLEQKKQQQASLGTNIFLHYFWLTNLFDSYRFDL